MRPITVVQTGMGESPPVPMDIRLNPANIALQVKVDGSATYTVQSTDSDIWNPDVAPVWTDHPTLADKSDTQVGNYAFPVTAIRLVVSAGDGTTELRIVQSGH